MKLTVPKFDLVPGLDLDNLERVGEGCASLLFSEEHQFALHLVVAEDSVPRWAIAYPVSRVEVLARVRALETMLLRKIPRDLRLRELAEAYRTSQGDMILAARILARLEERDADEKTTEAAAQDWRQLEAVRQSVQAARDAVLECERALLAYWRPGSQDASHAH